MKKSEEQSNQRRRSALLAALMVVAFGGAVGAVQGRLDGPALLATQGGVLPTPLPLFPADNWWNLDISAAPVDLNSATFISFINNGGNRQLHPDFGGTESPGSDAIYGFPYIVVDGTQAKKTVQFGPDADDESDGVNHDTNTSFPFYPIPDEAITQAHWIEGGPAGNVDLRDDSDRHILIVDKDNKHLYELYNVFHDGTTWRAYSGAFFDMNTNDRRPDGWTSADAAGLAILPGLVRYDEVFGPGEIEHALRVTLRASNGYVYPASHAAGSNPAALPMGARLRLKESFDIDGYSPEMQKIFRAMKKYGLIMADNGSDMYISGTFDTRWDNDILNPAFHSLHANDFDVIELGYNPPSGPVVRAQSLQVTEPNTGQVSQLVHVTLSPAASDTVTADYATANGTATAPGDFVAQSGSLTFLAGETSKDIFIPIVGDTTPEGTESFTVVVSNVVGAAAGSPGVIQILDNDSSVLSIGDATVTEGNSGTVNATFTISLSPASASTVTVSARTANKTAIAGTDYNAAGPTKLTFSPGQTTKTFSVAVRGDTIGEGNETFAVNLSAATGPATIGDAQGLGTIIDNDATPVLSVNDATVTEGNTGTINATFTITLSPAATENVTVSAKTANNTAVSGTDYTALAATKFTFLPGETSKTLTVAVRGDTRDEATETFFVNLTSPTGPAVIGDAQGVGTINDNDAPPTLSILNRTIAEGNSGTAAMAFTVKLSAASGQTVTVSAQTANGTAIAGPDYNAAGPTTLTFAPGQVSKTFTVTVKGDVLDEPNETFFVNLSSPTNATMADAQGLGTITDNDATPTLSINDRTVTEGNTGSTNVTFTVTLSAASGKTVTVSCRTAKGTAASDVDFSATGPLTLTFNPGVTTQTFVVPVLGDTLAEADETFVVNLTTGVNATIADPQGTASIIDNDAAAAAPALTGIAPSLAGGLGGAR